MTSVALAAEPKKVVTVEGLAKGKTLHPIQQAFWEMGGAQCGICTPGMLIASASLLAKNPRPDEAQIREGLAGNLIESRLDDRVGDHTPALLHDLLPTLLVGGFRRGEVWIVVNARPGHDFAATCREHLRSWSESTTQVAVDRMIFPTQRETSNIWLMELTIKVLASPGTPTSRQWPRQKRA